MDTSVWVPAGWSATLSSDHFARQVDRSGEVLNSSSADENGRPIRVAGKDGVVRRLASPHLLPRHARRLSQDFVRFESLLIVEWHDTLPVARHVLSG